jgi:hypothetical protein
VYSVEASRERRITVEDVRIAGGAATGGGTYRQDAGRLRQGADTTFTFAVMNTGTRPMRLLDSRADCGCTAAELPQGSIAPGASVPVQVHFNGRAPEGLLERTVTIRTDGDPGIILLTIAGEVVME